MIDKILTLHPDPEKKGVNIDRAKYDLVRNEIINVLSTNPNLKPIYFNQTPIEGFDWFKHLMFKRKMGMPRPHNVLIPTVISSYNY